MLTDHTLLSINEVLEQADHWLGIHQNGKITGIEATCTTFEITCESFVREGQYFTQTKVHFGVEYPDVEGV